MRLRIDKIWFIVVALVLAIPSAHAQIVTANPLEWMALAEGNEAINGEIEKEIKGQTKTALLQNTIAAEFTKIHDWVIFFLMFRRPPRSTLFPYTTLLMII